MGRCADLRGWGGGLQDVAMEEGTGRRVVKVRHGVRLVGSWREMMVGCQMMMTWLIRTESGRRIHASEVRIITERIRRQQTASTAATDVIQLLMFYVTSGPGVVHCGSVSGRGSGRGNPAALVGRGATPDGESRARGGGPTFAVGARLVLVVRTGEFDVRRGRREGDEPSLGSAGRGPGAGEVPRVQIDTRRR